MSHRPAIEPRATPEPRAVHSRALLERVIRPVSLATALLVLTLGCETALTDVGDTSTTVSLEVAPASTTLAPGETAQMEATLQDENGNAVSGFQVSWSSEDPSVATVDGDGLVTAEVAGSTQITATAQKDDQSLTGQADVTVEDGSSGGDGGDGGSASGNVITDLQPAAYETDTLETEEAVYVDRSFTIQGVPSGYSGWTYVRTANDDKNLTGDSAVVFTLQDTATVAIGYDERANTLPDWLQDWTTTGDTLRTNDVNFPVYTRDFAPGDVALGGNMSGGAQGANSMYVLFASASDSSPDDGGSGGDGGDGGDTATGSLEVTTATSGDDQDTDGYTVSVDGGSGQAVGSNGSVTLSDLATGDHSVQLSGVAGNCSVSGNNPRTISVVQDDTISTAFDVSCSTVSTDSLSDVSIPSSSDFGAATVVLTPGPSGAWDARLAGPTPSSLIKVGDTYYMYYVGAAGDRAGDGGPARRAVGLATSTDGINFTKHSSNPVISFEDLAADPNNDEQGAWGVFAMEDGGDIILYVSVLTEGVSGDIHLFTSSDGVNFTDQGVMVDNDDGAFAGNDELYPQMVWKGDDGIWHLFYGAKGTDVPNWSTHHASGPSRDSFTTYHGQIHSNNSRSGGSLIAKSHTELLILESDGDLQGWVATTPRTDPANWQHQATWDWNDDQRHNHVVHLNRQDQTWRLYYGRSSIADDDIQEVVVRTAPVSFK